MQLFEDFILNIGELISIVYLWDKLIFDNKKRMLKSLFIVVFGAFGMTFITYFNFSFIVMYVFLIVIWSVIYKKNVINASLEFLMILVILTIIQIPEIELLEMLQGNTNYDFKMYVLMNCITFLIVILLYKLVLKKIVIYIKLLESKVLYCFIINYSLYIIIFKLIWKYDKRIIINNKIIFLLVAILILIVQTYLYVYFTKLINIKKEFEIKNRYEPIMDNIIEEIRRRQHDFKNNINTINGIIETSHDGELRNKLRGYMDTLDFFNINLGEIMYIKNSILKAIIYTKICEAKKRDIKFKYNIQHNSLEDILMDYEISDILNNIINNAFEALESKENNKIIILNILMKNDKNIIEIKNNGDIIDTKNLKNIFKIGFSTKAGHKRGYGLYNVKNIVNRNHGSIQLFIEDDFICFHISF
ncbi:GHKL domain-containing protein [Clostridium botulinum C]|uniref:sensor histidine kinase n=1 Tax=Clostridium botulinum TaxID=1491 RepID=UPI001E2E2F71|nr:GHKL domain-containing protein [Clostridium botulinum]MCD3218196.1 GHKL domain-containing protein [Clostridium botulinum C]